MSSSGLTPYATPIPWMIGFDNLPALTTRAFSWPSNTSSQLTRDQRRALQRLARVPRGIVSTLMVAHGFSREFIRTLVLAGLVTVVIDTVKIGEETIDVDLVMITDIGREAIEG